MILIHILFTKNIITINTQSLNYYSSVRNTSKNLPIIFIIYFIRQSINNINLLTSIDSDIEQNFPHKNIEYH